MGEWLQKVHNAHRPITVVTIGSAREVLRSSEDLDILPPSLLVPVSVKIVKKTAISKLQTAKSWISAKKVEIVGLLLQLKAASVIWVKTLNKFLFVVIRQGDLKVAGATWGIFDLVMGTLNLALLIRTWKHKPWMARLIHMGAVAGSYVLGAGFLATAFGAKTVASVLGPVGVYIFSIVNGGKGILFLKKSARHRKEAKRGAEVDEADQR